MAQAQRREGDEHTLAATGCAYQVGEDGCLHDGKDP
jgi:hypothetical protein